MRVALFTNKTTQASLGVLECLTNSSRLELVHVFFHDTLAAARGSPWQTLQQLGLKSVAQKVWQQFSGRLRLARRRCGGTGSVQPHSALELAVMQRLSHSIIADMNYPEAISCVHDLQLDVMVVCVCKNILRRQLLALPRTRFVNIHPSLLPQYRGPCPVFWALFHGDRLTGVTLHEMTTRIDQGSLLA
jgi:methionyl-tRNA formyltransferase